MNILITGALKCSDAQLKIIEKMGFNITFVQDERIPLDIDCSEFEAVICNGLFLYTSIEKFTNLKFVQLTSAGLDRAPVEYINKHSIILHNARGVYSIPMSEWVMQMALQIYKSPEFFIENKKKHKWEKLRNIIEIHGKTVCVVGTGSVGVECLKRFKAFGTITTGVDIASANNEYIDKFYLFDEMDKALSEADIVVLTLPLNEHTKGIFNQSRFSVMKDNSVLINVSRGGIINENDLIEALSNGKFMGVALDVFESEPLSEKSELWDFDNVIITPHNSFVSEANHQRLFDVIINNLKCLGAKNG